MSEALNEVRATLGTLLRQVSGRDASGAWRGDLMVCAWCGDVNHRSQCRIKAALDLIDAALIKEAQ